MFGVEVDETAAETAGNYKIGANSPATAELQEDGKTVKLTFASAAHVEVENAAIVVEPIESADDQFKSTVRYAGLFTFEDVVKPEIASVESKSMTNTADTVTVTFSEPVKSLGAVKIDGVVKTATGFVAGDETATFTGLTLDAATSHTIQFVGLKDQGDNVVDNVTKTFSVTTDAVAPTAQLSAKSDSTIVVTFDKAMNVASVTAALAAAQNVVKDEVLGDVAYANAAVVAGSGDKQFSIKVTDPLFADATSRTLTVVLPNTMTDSLGNKVAATTKQVTLTKDTVAPSLTGLTFKKNNDGEVVSVTLKVSEGLPANAITPSNTNLTIVDENGVLVPTTGFLGGLQADTPVAGGTELTFDATTAAKLSGKYTFSFAKDFVTDDSQAQNKSAAASFTLDFGAADSETEFELSDTVEGAGQPIDASTTDNVVVVDFEGAVKGGSVAGSATDLANYTLNGSALPAGTTITLDSAKQVATITLPAESIATSDSAAVFTISNVQRSTGETIKYTTTTIPVTDNVTPTMNSAVLNSDNTITFGFSETLAVAPAAADVEVTVNGGTLDVSGIAPAVGTGLNAGKYVLDLSSLVAYDAGTTTTYVDMDADTTLSAGDITITTTGDVTSTFKFSTSTVITDVKLGTKATALTAADAAGNKAKSSIKIDVK